MNDAARGIVPGDRKTVRHYKREFWSKENLKFSQPWYRLEKTVRLINRLARGKECSLLDIGCGPATLMRMLPKNIDYYGIDIAIHNPATNLIEVDLLGAPIRFGDKRFDIVVALGVFEYMADSQSQKFAEIARLLNDDGLFIASYTNFGHRNKRIYEAFSNVQPLGDFRCDLARYFDIVKFFPASHNWAHGLPSREAVKAINMHVNMNIPFIGPVLAVEYFFICSPRGSRRSRAQP